MTMKIELNVSTAAVTVTVRMAGGGANSTAVQVTRFFDSAAL